MRKSIGLSIVVLVIVMVLTSGTAFAGNGIPISGPHWNINIIGHPAKEGGIGEGGDSSGHSIMIPLKTAPGPDLVTCTSDGVKFKDDTGEVGQTLEPTGGARIYFVGGPTFEIIDRDATDKDGSAKIMLPIVDTSEGTTGEFKFQVYMRVLGKPNKYDPSTGEGTVACMNINAYAYTTDESNSTLWYKAGAVTVSRGKGKSSFVRVTDLFMVLFCPTVDTCSNLSVFNDIFSGYFWQILNDGTRLVQVRIYPTDTVYSP